MFSSTILDLQPSIEHISFSSIFVHTHCQIDTNSNTRRGHICTSLGLAELITFVWKIGGLQLSLLRIPINTYFCISVFHFMESQCLAILLIKTSAKRAENPTKTWLELLQLINYDQKQGKDIQHKWQYSDFDHREQGTKTQQKSTAQQPKMYFSMFSWGF